jgi:transmembrane protein EpsG
MSLEVEEAGLGTYLVIAARVALLAFIVWRVVEEDQARWFTWSVISTGFLILGTQNVVIARLSLYFGIFLVLLLATQMRKRDQPMINAGIYLAAGVYMAMHLQSYGDLLPYQTYWTF